MPLKIIVVGTAASDPYAGMAWMHMQIVAGFNRLGHDVYYFETTSTWPYNPQTGSRVDNPDYALYYLKRLTSDFGLKGKWAYRCSYRESKDWFGLTKKKAEDLLATADLVFNISGSTRFKEEDLKTGRLIYYGTDPVYHEIKYSQGDEFVKSVIEEHDNIVTFGENIGTPISPIPPLPRLTAKTRQPILLDLWKSSKHASNKFTTVGNWKQAGRDLEFNGETYFWSKHHEFLKFLDTPKRVCFPIEVAMNLASLGSADHGKGTEIPSLGAEKSELDLLKSNGWLLKDAPAFTTNPWDYRDYIQDSMGEFSFAKDQNIRLKSGWFSERSACYLAAGRPVITQDTSFGTVLPVGEGLFSFNTMEEIIEAFKAINADYNKHSKAARDIAEEFFKAEKVLDKLIKDLT